jgi:hypothetical protein
MTPLFQVFSYSVVFWTVFVWAFWPELRIIGRATLLFARPFGEGYSDTVVRLLAIRRDQLDTLRRHVSSDSTCHDFVLRHVDATTDEDDLEKILVSDRTRCPAGANESAGTRSTRSPCSLSRRPAH